MLEAATATAMDTKDRGMCGARVTRVAVCVCVCVSVCVCVCDVCDVGPGCVQRGRGTVADVSSYRVECVM